MMVIVPSKDFSEECGHALRCIVNLSSSMSVVQARREIEHEAIVHWSPISIHTYT